MRYAYIVRPYPHGFYRINEFLTKNIVAIGWPNIGDLSPCKNRDDVKKKLSPYYTTYTSPQSLGQAVGNISRFMFDLGENDYVIVPDGPIVYFGTVISKYKYDVLCDGDIEGYPHQREVKWFYDKKAIPRNLLTGRVYESLKGRQTIFTTYHDDVDDIVKNKKHYFTQQSNADLKKEYLERLQSGLLRNVNPNTFEDAVCSLYGRFFAALTRLGTTTKKKGDTKKRGDTDLLAELPGKVIVRIQVKNFYPAQGELKDDVVDQLADSMDPGDHGIIITSGTISQEAKDKAEGLADKTISFINGEEFVEDLFDVIDQLPPEALAVFGVMKGIGFI